MSDHRMVMVEKAEADGREAKEEVEYRPYGKAGWRDGGRMHISVWDKQVPGRHRWMPWRGALCLRGSWNNANYNVESC